ncbi:Phosphoenolpyruvate carboxylase 4 [Abeliophyllum distichum]|uniref:Phosphoenolpyruvate carboxylase 4 n=1 Tax=Abeliophyllum distichum TaxID=126358 RepID=A0ABD1NUJ4_9LAMI
MTDITDDIAEEISFQGFEDDCRLLGSLLNDVFQKEVGTQFMVKVERTRVLAQSACNMRAAGIEDTAELLEKQLAAELSKMTLEEALSLARVFSHYLNLTGIAETHHRVTKAKSLTNLSKSCDDTFNKLMQAGVSPDELYDAVCKQHLLEYNDRPDLGHEDREMLIEDLVREITSICQTDEIKRHKPTPVDEARAGLNIVEQSLWRAVPHYVRRVSNALKKHTGRPLPLTCTPIKFGSWMGGDRDGNPNVTAKVTRDVSLLSRWMAIELYIREIDNLRFELSMIQCNDHLSTLAHEILEKEKSSENQHENWNQLKHHSHHAPPFPTQLPAGADLPSCTECNNVESRYPPLDVPGSDFMPLNRQDGQTSSRVEGSTSSIGKLSIKTTGNGNVSNLGNAQSAVTPKAISFSSSQLLAQRKLFAESQIGRTSFQRLLEPSSSQQPGIAPYRVVLGFVKEMRLELLLEDLPCEYDPCDYFETSDQLLEPLLLCYDSLQSCGSGILADGRLGDLIRRVATFGMVLMKLDLRQESGRHSETLDAITRYLDMGTYSEWNEDKKLEFLTRELKGKRPLVPSTIEVCPDLKEVLDTFKVAAELGSDSLGAYVISMASHASDVLAVELLQKDARLSVAGELGRACPGGT